MNIALTIIGIAVAVWCIVSNIYVIRVKSAKEMYAEYIECQCIVGVILVNIFYLPAWILKGLRFLAVAIIK